MKLDITAPPIRSRVWGRYCLGLMLLVPGYTLSQAPQGSQQQVNSTETGDQNRAASAMASNGDFMVVWDSEVSPGDNYGAVMAQFFRNGSPMGPEILVNELTQGLQSNPAVAVDGSGQYLVVWQSDVSSGSDDSGSSIQGRRFNSNGSAVGSQFQLNSYTTSAQEHPSVSSLDSGFVVAWTSYGSAGNDDFLSSVQTRTVSSTGVPLGSDYQSNVADIFHQRNPVVEGNGSGFVVVWESGFSYGGDNSGDSLQLRPFSGPASPASGEIQANSVTGSHQRRASILRRSNGEYLVSWDSPDSAGSDSFAQSVQLRRFSSSGSPIGAEFQVNSHTDAGQRNPSIAPTHDGGFVVAWHSDDSVDDQNYGRVVQLQRLSSSLSPVGSIVEINQDPVAAESRPTVVGDGEGNLAVIWEQDFSLGSGDSEGQSVHYRLASTAPVCQPSSTALCLQDGRFRVEASWENQNDEEGDGQAVELTEDTGYFWFFNSSNVEMVVKVLDACGPFDNFWVFAGGLTDQGVELRITDTLAGVTRTYENSLGTPFQPIQDTAAFQTCQFGSLLVEPGVEDLVGGTSLFLNDDRFEVSAEWETPPGDQGLGQPFELTPDTGYFWFFNPANVEMVVKVLDACTFNDRFWVFAAGLTDVEVTLTVRDTETNQTKQYVNPQGTQFQPILDSDALAVCP